MKNINGFTLSEALITLAIIGVIAAITLPSIIQKYKRLVASTRLKHFYSMMSQAILSSEIDNGPSKIGQKMQWLIMQTELTI